jgi:thioredoxin-like negative regulator of GroEL
MQIRLTCVRTILLMIVLLPFVAALRLVRALRRREKPVYASSIDDAPLDYVGENPILIVVWADWAHVWDIATSGIVERLREEFAGRCEFAFVEATSRAVRDAYGAQVIPTLILRHHGADIERFVNVLRPDDVRSAIAAAVGRPVSTSDTVHRP